VPALRVCALPPRPPSHAFGGSYTAKKKKSEKTGRTTTTNINEIMRYARNETDERKRKVMTTLSDMVMQCGGGGCCVLEQCFQYPRRAREPRDCGCQFALLHRADIAWPSVHVLKISILFFLWPYLYMLKRNLGSTEALTLSFYYCLSFTLTRLFLLCLCVTPSLCLYIFLSHFWTSTRTLPFFVSVPIGKL